MSTARLPLLASGLRARIVLLALLAALPGVIVGYVAAQRTHASDEREARAEAVRTAQLAGFGGREFLLGARMFLRTLAELPLVHRATSPRCAALVRELAALRPAYADLGIAAPSGDVVCSASAQPGVGSVAAETWFTRALRDGVFTVGAFQGGGPGRGTIGLGYPVRRGRSVVGVAFAKLRAEAVQGVLEQAELPAGGAILVLDARGSVVAARPRSAAAGRAFFTAPLQALLPLRVQRFERRDEDGERRLYTMTQVGEPGSGLLLAVGIPTASVLGAAESVLTSTLLAVSLSGLLGLALALVAAGRLVLRPVSALSSAAARLARGDLTARSGIAGAAGEIGALGRVFDGMAEALEERARERMRAEEELRRSLVRLREAEAARRALLSRFLRAEEKEREQIATDLRDDSLQALEALTLRLGLLRRQVDGPQALETLEAVEGIVRDVLERLRRLTDRLRPPALDRDGLAAALRTHLGEAAGERGIEWSLDNRLPAEPQAETRAIVYAIAQEAIENAVRHAGPSRIDVALERLAGGVKARVRDDGAGFEPTGSRGLVDVGLEWMRARAETAGGWWRIESAPGAGTTVEVFVPELPGEQEPAG